MINLSKFLWLGREKRPAGNDCSRKRLTAGDDLLRRCSLYCHAADKNQISPLQILIRNLEH